ncbi:MAG: Lrp/AsnC family transcriptional regulator [Fidelibacterota bacterium]
MKLDSTDRNILNILQSDGRITNAELAKRVNMSPSPTLERVKKLERTGIIKGYVALLDPVKAGTPFFSFVEVTLVRHGTRAVQRFMTSITQLEEVLECHHITGGADFLLKVATRDIPSYETFIVNKLTALEDVQHLKTLVVLSTLKQETRIPINGGKS